MACTRHKEKRRGEIVPVLRGLAKDVVAEANQLHLVAFKTFRFLRGCKGKSKIKIDARWWLHKAEVWVHVCDNEHGEGLIVFAAPHVAAVGRHLSRRLAARGIVVM